MIKMKLLPTLLLLAITLGSCVNIMAPEVRSVTCCELKKATKLDAEVSFGIEVYNGNSFPIVIKGHDLEVRLNDNTLGTSKTSHETILTAGEVNRIEVAVVTSTKDLVSGTLMMGLNSLMKNNPTTLEVEVVGSVIGKAKGVSRRVKIREKYPFKMHP